MLAGFLDGVDPSVSWSPQVTPAPRAPVPPLEALLERAEASRGELIALRHDADAARLAARAAERRRVPEPEVVAGTKSSTVGTGDIGSVLMVHATLPLFDRAKPEAQPGRGARGAGRRRGPRPSAWCCAATSPPCAPPSSNGAPPPIGIAPKCCDSSGEIERIAQVSYDAGERGILELLDAYRVAAEARLRQAALDLAARRAEIELEFATGWELPL